jgi:hypothetical protein
MLRASGSLAAALELPPSSNITSHGERTLKKCVDGCAYSGAFYKAAKGP